MTIKRELLRNLESSMMSRRYFLTTGVMATAGLALFPLGSNETLLANANRWSAFLRVLFKFSRKIAVRVLSREIREWIRQQREERRRREMEAENEQLSAEGYYIPDAAYDFLQVYGADADDFFYPVVSARDAVNGKVAFYYYAQSEDRFWCYDKLSAPVIYGLSCAVDDLERQYSSDAIKSLLLPAPLQPYGHSIRDLHSFGQEYGVDFYISRRGSVWMDYERTSNRSGALTVKIEKTYPAGSGGTILERKYAVTFA